MAILGGGVGGAGNPVGGSFTGPAEALEIYGDFAAAYSGLFPASTTETVELSFTTGNYLFVGVFQLNGPVDDDAPGSQNKAMAKLSLNGVPVSLIANAAGDNGPFSIQQDVIIPAYTEVEVVVVANGNESDRYGSVTITGKIIRD